MDKRRYVSRDPRNPRMPESMAADETGNAAVDGYTIRSREPLKGRSRPRYSDYDCVAPSLKDENEVSRDAMYGDW